MRNGAGIALAQNFLKDRRVVSEIISNCSIDNNDTVYEIGPGEGIITRELAKAAGKVVAVEADSRLALRLAKQLTEFENVHVHSGDFLSFSIDDCTYKVLANIPFNATSAIMRKLMNAQSPPIEASLIVQREVAEKYCGVPNECQVSVLAKPWFRFKIVRHFRKSDFDPAPAVDVALLCMTKRDKPLLCHKDAETYDKFVRHGFGAAKKSLKLNYKGVFTYTQWKRLSREIGFPLGVSPSQLSLHDWIGLFRFFKRSECNDG